MKEQDKITKEQLKLEYIDNNMSLDQISKKYGIKRGTLMILTKKYDLKKDRTTIMNNINAAVLKKYGVENISKLDGIYDKKRQTYLKHYGVDNPLKSDLIKKKIKETNLKKYGVEHHLKLSKYMDKQKATNLKRYGVEFAIKNEKVLEKQKATNLKRYGVEWTGQIEKTRQQARETMLKKYGTVAPAFNTGKDQHYIEIYENDDKFTHFITEDVNGQTISQISTLSGYSESALLQKIHKLGLDDFVDIKPKTSHYEDELIEFIKSIGVSNIEKNAKVLGAKEIDIYLPDYKIGIEFNGYYWHSSIYKNKMYHQNKSKLAESLGIRIIHIYENEWIDPTKQNILKSFLTITLNKCTSIIYARNCSIKEITNKEAQPFNDANHLQGHRNAAITYGLFYKDKLVQLMSFSKHKKYEWEIIRGCPGSNNIVVGGVSKLFNYFIKTHNPSNIFSYCDYNKFNGKSYEALGMKYIGLTTPDLKYIINGQVYNRNPGKYNENKNNIKLYGAGSKKYLWEKKTEK